MQANIPVINALINPSNSGKSQSDPTIIILSEKSIERISFPIFPNIIGITIKKENLAAFSLSIPNSIAVDIVAPDLEIPGKIAIA